MSPDPNAQQDSSAGKPESSPFVAPQISLPKGGGAIRGIGEKFQANAATGTGKLTVPLAVSKGRSGFGPDLSLSYDSGSPNGICGMGWSHSLPSITGKTDKGLPKYRRHEKEECDVFILSGAEDLVPVLVLNRDGHWVGDEFDLEGYRVKRYRPRIEGLFARIERWTRLQDGDEHWRSISKDNTLTVYGRTEESRIFDPENHRHVFSWLICESFDDKGNAISYEYVAENEQCVDFARVSEARRIRTANRYPKRIRYGNRRPLLRDDNCPGFRASHLKRPDFEGADWMFEVVFDYGDGHYHEEEKDADGRQWVTCSPEIRPDHHWPVRKDPFSRYRSRFEVRTYRLCQRVLMFHHFTEELGTELCLVRSTEFDYRQKAVGSFITQITQSGYTRHADCRYLKKSMPPLDLDYTSSPLESERYHEYQVRDVDPVSLENLPSGIDGGTYRWVDLNGEGISGVLTEEGTGWYYKPNAGHGRFGATELVARKPSLAALGRGQQQLLDIAGDGTLNLVQFETGAPGFFKRTLSEGWGDFRTFRSLPVLDWKDPNLKFVDVTGDGIADILITENEAFLWHESLLDEGFGSAIRVAVSTDEGKGPHVIFADGVQSIYLADMSGDGLSDLVRIRNGEVCYWPNLGYGVFGRKVVMDNAPWFEDDDLFDQSRVKLADTDGSGCTDIVYLGSEEIQIYLNEAGNGWTNARTLPQFAPTSLQTSVSVVDLLGRGTACLLWSSTLPGDSRQSLRYVDLMDGQKPHLLVKIQNNLGAETRVEYASSTEFYLADKAAGRPWFTHLPFPVHVVKRVETYDHISHNRFVNSYTYHHGFFDGVEREFRGFGRVEQLDTEEFATLSQRGVFPVGTNVDRSSNVPPMLTKTWFHTGLFLGNGRLSRHLAHEYYREPIAHAPGERGDPDAAMLLDDTILPEHLTPQEAREASRALKGSMLRQELYAFDGQEESDRPYTVAESNWTIVPLQQQQHNLHAVFFTHPREAVTFHYERRLYEIDGARHADPRVAHNLTLEVDDYGNVLKSASVGYGRRFPDGSPLLMDADRHRQSQILLTFAENRFTNAVQERHSYRIPLPAETRNYELIHITPRAKESGITNLFRFEELEAEIVRASDGRHDLAFEDLDAVGAVEEAPYRRHLAESRTYYRADRLDRILPLGALEALALPGQTYKLAFTPGLLSEVYRRELHEELIPDTGQVLHRNGKYVELTGDGRWWIPSGRVFYAPQECESAEELGQARRHFFLPRRFVDPFNDATVVRYDRHDLMPVELRDAAGNTVASDIDYRVLAPYRMTDANRNRSQVAFDALGRVAGTAVMGKQSEHSGDSLDGFEPDPDESAIVEHFSHPLRNPQDILKLATTRVLYNLFAYVRTREREQPQPPSVCTISRETHVADLAQGQQTKIQHAFSYSDGFQREIQKKVQAEPGPIIDDESQVNPRWVGSGWTIFNNKGKPVRKYEPFFSATHTFEFASIVGVSAVLFYDPLDRVVGTLHPNHTYEKVVFDPWSRENWDVNDTVLQTRPDRDSDVGEFFSKLPKDDYLPTWHDQRGQGQLGWEEQQAAMKTAVHANTPTVNYFDALGRTFLTVVHNRFEREGKPVDEYFATRTELDVQNNRRAVVDALGRVVMRYEYDMLSARLRQASVDSGTRWMLNDVLGKLLLQWDSRSHRFRHEYDVLHRPTNFYVQTGGQAEILAERIVYGEGQPNDYALNLRNKPFLQYDAAGLITNERYDFKGNLLKSSRRLLEDYRSEVNWAQSPEVETVEFRTATAYDALNRTIALTTPDFSVVRPRYNEANLLESLVVNLRGAQELTPFVSFINYNAKGQREVIDYGNGVHTRYAYDRLTFRMIGLATHRKHDDHARLQDLHYTFDPVGNITSIRDAAQENIYFKNQVVSASNEYVYDAIYRLISADGREHVGKPREPQTTHDDLPRMNHPLRSDGHALHRYREHYDYDAVGNILRLLHTASDGNWSRHYYYDEPCSEPRNNRLTHTGVGQNEERYTYDADGNVTSMPHLHRMDWDFKDRLHVTRQQATNTGRGETTYFVYNSAGQRVRKITERGSGSRKDERTYLGSSFEIYRKYDSVGAVALRRETLHVMDDKRRVALVETKTIDDSRPIREPNPRIRFQFDNHLGSAIMELDAAASIITYEEYYPYGSTSFQASETESEVSKKRYRYTSKERDEETGFYYHGARYCAPWLARWISCDPVRTDVSQCPYNYVGNNPIKLIDPKGENPEDANAKSGIGRQLWNTIASGAHAIVEGAIWNPTVWGSISRNARIARDTTRGVILEKFAGNFANPILNRITGGLGRYAQDADRATATVVQQIKSSSQFSRIARITQNATEDAADFIAGNAAYAGHEAQARILLPTGTPAAVIRTAENAVTPIPGLTAAPKVTTGLPGVGGLALKALAPIGAALSAQALGEDLAKKDYSAAVTDASGAVAGGLETFAIVSTAVGAGGTATAGAAGGVALAGAGGGAAAAASVAAPVVASFGVGVAVGTYINNNTGISETAMKGGEWVEKQTGSVILGATGAALTAIGTSPYYAAEAAAGALEKTGNWLGDTAYSLLH